jgi:hypothetical protein
MNLIYSFTGLIHLYPYHSREFSIFAAALFIIVIVLPVYGVYRLIIWKMKERSVSVFNTILTITGICLMTLFFAEITLILITQHQVNRQLGFNYATPETPEGELFEIIRVDPGKTMDKAGLKQFDVVQMWNTSHLYKLLINNQGKEVTFSVIRDEKEIIIRVMVPEMYLPLRKVVFLF